MINQIYIKDQKPSKTSLAQRETNPLRQRGSDSKESSSVILSRTSQNMTKLSSSRPSVRERGNMSNFTRGNVTDISNTNGYKDRTNLADSVSIELSNTKDSSAQPQKKKVKKFKLASIQMKYNTNVQTKQKTHNKD